MTDDLARRLAPALAPWFLTRDGSRDLGRGTAFPSTDVPGGVQAGDRFFRTDLGWACYHDGTRWLSPEAQASLGFASASANGAMLYLAQRTDYAPYVTRVALNTNTAATNNGTNFWTVQIRGVNATYGGASIIHSRTTAADTAGAWVATSGIPATTLTPADYYFFDVVVTKTLAPGAITLTAALWYRLIVT